METDIFVHETVLKWLCRSPGKSGDWDDISFLLPEFECYVPDICVAVERLWTTLLFPSPTPQAANCTQPLRQNRAKSGKHWKTFWPAQGGSCRTTMPMTTSTEIAIGAVLLCSMLCGTELKAIPFLPYSRHFPVSDTRNATSISPCENWVTGPVSKRCLAVEKVTSGKWSPTVKESYCRIYRWRPLFF